MNVWPPEALRLLCEYGASALCGYDDQDRIVFWNARYLEFFPEVAPVLKVGLPFVDTVRPFLRLQHPRMPPENLDAEVRAALERHRQVQTPMRYQRADSGRWLELRMFPQPGGGRIKVWNDVSAEQAAASGSGLLELLIVANVGLIVHEEDGRLAFINSRYFSEMFLAVLTAPPDIRQRAAHCDYWPRFRDIFGGDATFQELCASPGQGALAQPVTLLARTGRWFRIEEQAWRGGIASIWTDVSDLVERERALQAAYAEVIALNAQLRDRAETDSLTGLPNRRRFEVALADAQARVDAGAACAVAIIDIDHFKRVNDRFGHSTGDAVLVEVANCMRQTLPQADMLARLGGEEFGMLLCDADAAQAALRAQELRQRVAALRCDNGVGGCLSVTISVGTAGLQPRATPAQALRHADLAMFRAKKQGRNRVVMADGS